MREKVLTFLTDCGMLVQSEAMEYILAKPEPMTYVKSVLDSLKDQPFMLTVEHLQGVDVLTKSALKEPKPSKVMETETKNRFMEKPSTVIEEETQPRTKEETSKVIEKEPPKMRKETSEIIQKETELKIRDRPSRVIEKEIKPVFRERPTKIIKIETEQRIKERPLIEIPRQDVASYANEIVCSVSALPEDIKLHADITGKSTCQGKIGDFKLYFNDRLKTLKRYIKMKREMTGAIPLSRIKRAEGTFKVIGMVSEIRTTQRGNKLITLEDEDSTVNILLTKENDLTSDPTVLDEVIGVVCSRFKDDGVRKSPNILMASGIVRPDIPVNRSMNLTRTESKVAFVSDIHVGSKTFLAEEFKGFLRWLSGKEAEKVEYMVVPGDTVDGIGIYPDQEEELEINDIYGQYEELARLISGVPERIKVIMMPGNHDAVRPAEPQPTFPKEIRDLFKQNVFFMGNPCYFSLNGVEILAYHGRSMDDFIRALPSLDYSKAMKIMVEMLKKRHLVPIYGGRTPIAPEHRDYLVIDRVPDIFVTGHGHATDSGRYHGVTLLNASAWQSQTKYQKMHNFQPDPAKVLMVNLATGTTEIRSFL